MDLIFDCFALFLQDYKRFIKESEKPGHMFWEYFKQSMEEFWFIIILVFASMFCSYFAKLSCKLCMQFAGFSVPLLLAGPATVSHIPVLRFITIRDKNSLHAQSSGN